MVFFSSFFCLSKEEMKKLWTKLYNNVNQNRKYHQTIYIFINHIYRTIPNKILKITGDLSSSEFCSKIVEETAKKFGTINILVNDLLIFNL
jgi:hypothetical protein